MSKKMTTAEFRKRAGKGTIGKRMPGRLYIHWSAVQHLQKKLSTMLEKAIHIAEKKGYREGAWNIASIDTRTFRYVALNLYPGFNIRPHPELTRSIRIDVVDGTVVVATYSSRPNPPILHQKELFIHKNNPNYQKFLELSQQEEAAGLLGRSDIGNRRHWEALLKERGYKIEGHKLIKLANTEVAK
jgi:DNA phosphorothioation-associated putative methyltransferase